MSVIVALSDGEETWVGADSMANYSGTKLYGVPKWGVANGWAVGICGQVYGCNIVVSSVDELTRGVTSPRELASKLRDLLEGEGFQSAHPHNEEDAGARTFGQHAILASAGGVWSVDPSIGIVEIPVGTLWADGSGRGYALGAGNTARERGVGERVAAALDQAIRWDSNCGGDPFLQRVWKK